MTEEILKLQINSNSTLERRFVVKNVGKGKLFCHFYFIPGITQNYLKIAQNPKEKYYKL